MFNDCFVKKFNSFLNLVDFVFLDNGREASYFFVDKSVAEDILTRLADLKKDIDNAIPDLLINDINQSLVTSIDSSFGEFKSLLSEIKEKMKNIGDNN